GVTVGGSAVRVLGARRICTEGTTGVRNGEGERRTDVDGGGRTDRVSRPARRARWTAARCEASGTARASLRAGARFTDRPPRSGVRPPRWAPGGGAGGRAGARVADLRDCADDRPPRSARASTGARPTTTPRARAETSAERSIPIWMPEDRPRFTPPAPARPPAPSRPGRQRSGGRAPAPRPGRAAVGRDPRGDRRRTTSPPGRSAGPAPRGPARSRRGSGG